MRTSESKDHYQLMLLVPLLNPKFAIALPPVGANFGFGGTSDPIPKFASTPGTLTRARQVPLE